MSSSFDKEFSALRALGEETFVLRGSSIIVELQAAEEIKTASGLIVSTGDAKRGATEAHKLEVGKVLMVGQGYWTEDKEAAGRYEPLEVQPGAICILPQYGTSYISVFPGITRPTHSKLALIKMDQVLAYYPSQEAFELAKAKLNG